MNLKCKKIFTGLALSAMVFSSVVSVSAQKTDYAKSKERFQLQYKGYIQFVGSYCIPEDAGYHLVAGKNVKQAYQASAYAVDGLQLSVTQDIFTHRSQTRRRIERESSSSGNSTQHSGSYSGTSGKF